MRALKDPLRVQPVTSHISQRQLLHLILVPDPISVVEHRRPIVVHVCSTCEATLNARGTIPLIAMPPWKSVLRLVPGIPCNATSIKGYVGFIVCGLHQFIVLLQALFKLRRDDPIAPDMGGSRVWLLAWVNIEKSSRVAGLDDFTCEDRVGQTGFAAVSFDVLGYAGCIIEDRTATGAMKGLGDAVHLYSVAV